MNPQVLVADLDRQTPGVLQFALESAGLGMLQAQDGNTVWELIQTRNPSVVLIHVGLPGLSSQEIIRRIRASTAFVKLPVILLGDPTTVEESVRWLESGADGYVMKPFSVPVLIAQIRALIRRGEINRKRTRVAGKMRPF